MPPAVDELLSQLNLVRVTQEQSQTECAEELRREHGAPGRTQASMSRYLRGLQIPPASVVTAIQRYIHAHSVSTGDPGTTIPHDLGGAGVDEAFANTVRDVSGEPMLGPRQAAYVDAITSRLATGPPFSVSDLEIYRSMTHALGLPD